MVWEYFQTKAEAIAQSGLAFWVCLTTLAL
jgi:hypothetical protein